MCLGTLSYPVWEANRITPRSLTHSQHTRQSGERRSSFPSGLGLHRREPSLKGYWLIGSESGFSFLLYLSLRISSNIFNNISASYYCMSEFLNKTTIWRVPKMKGCGERVWFKKKISWPSLVKYSTVAMITIKVSKRTNIPCIFGK